MPFTRDTVAGLICLGLSLWMLYLTQGLPHSPLLPIGPAFYPRLLLILTAGISVAVIAIDLLSTRANADTDKRAAPSRNYRLVALCFVLFGGYVWLLPQLGYRVATVIFVAALQVTLEPPPGIKKAAAQLVTALATSLVTYLLFERYLLVLLPRGAWTGF